MSLTWSGLSASDFAEELALSSTVTRRESKKQLRRAAEQVMKTSRKGAPIDDGDLEAAHHIETIRLSKDNIELEISVGGMVGDTDVDEYAEKMHYGRYTLGPKSQVKDATGDVMVGPHFLDRAMDEHEDELTEAVMRTLPGD